MSQPVTIHHTGVMTFKGIDLQRYMQKDTLLDGSVKNNQKKGLGIVDGTAVGTYSYGFPVILSLPNFLNGADELYTKIDLYKGSGVDTKLDKASVKEKAEDYSVIVDIEPSTGKAMSGHNRLMLSLYAWACDPTNPSSPDCKLFMDKSLYDDQTTNPMPYAMSAANVLTPKMQPDIFIPTSWFDENSEVPDDTAAKFVKIAGQLQYLDAAAIALGMIGGTLVLFGVFGVFCSRAK